MNISNKTITTLLTISICINIFCLGFIAAKEFSPKRHKGGHPYSMEFKKHKGKAAAMLHHKGGKKGEFRKAMHEEMAADREKIEALRSEVAAIITAQDVDFPKVAELLREIKTVESGIRERMEKKFLERLSKMSADERQEYVEKIRAHRKPGRP